MEQCLTWANENPVAVVLVVSGLAFFILSFFASQMLYLAWRRNVSSIVSESLRVVVEAKACLKTALEQEISASQDARKHFLDRLEDVFVDINKVKQDWVTKFAAIENDGITANKKLQAEYNNINTNMQIDMSLQLRTELSRMQDYATKVVQDKVNAVVNTSFIQTQVDDVVKRFSDTLEAKIAVVASKATRKPEPTYEVSFSRNNPKTIGYLKDSEGYKDEEMVLNDNRMQDYPEEWDADTTRIREKLMTRYKKYRAGRA